MLFDCLRSFKVVYDLKFCLINIILIIFEIALNYLKNSFFSFISLLYLLKFVNNLL